MNELERALRSLPVEWPAEPALVPAVAARIAERPRPSRRRWAVAVAIAAMAALGAAFAVPQSRSSILRFLGLEGAVVTRVDRLPPAGRGEPAVGVRVPLARVRSLLGFAPLLPAGERPSAVYVDTGLGVLTLLYGRPSVRLRVFELRTGSPMIQKLVHVEQPVVPVRVHGRPGYFVSGRHVVYGFLGEPRLSGNALVFQTTELTVRLEGRFDRAEGVALAETFH